MANIRKIQNNADTYYERAEKYMDAGDYVNAVDYFNRSLSLEPFNPWTMCELADCYGLMGLHLPALGLYYRALAYDNSCELAYLGIINFMTTFSQHETAAYYLRLSAQTSALERIPAEFDVDIDYEEDSLPEKASKPTFRLTKSVRGEQYLSRAKRSLVSGDVTSAMESLQKVEVESPAFGEAAYYVSLISFDEGDYLKAIEYSDKLIAKDALDTRGYIIRVAVYDKLGDCEKKQQAVEKIMSIKPRSFVEAMGIAICFGDIGMYAQAELFYQYASSFMPYEKSALLPLAQCYHNNQKYDKARKVMVDLCKIYPEDYSCAWMAKYLHLNKGVELPNLGLIPEEAKKQLSSEILQALSKYSTIRGLERAFDESDQLYEKMVMLFSSNDFETIGYASEVLALSSKLRPLLRRIPVRMDAPFGIKQRCLTLLLQHGKRREYSAYVGDVIRFFTPRIPHCTEDKNLIGAYWKSYATLSLLGLGCEKKLYSVFRKFCSRVQEKNVKVQYFQEVSAVLASQAFSLCIKELRDAPMRKLADFCELFGADVEKSEELANIIGE